MYQYLSAPLAGFALLAALAAATPAAAQDAAAFQGPRVEATVGLDQLRFDLSNIGSAGRAKASDVGFGFALGYDKAVSPNMVIGAEAGMNFSDVSYADDALRSRREFDFSGRIGTPVTHNALLYGKVGYSNLQVREVDQLRNLDGLLLGAGAEVKVSPVAYLKSEYRYVTYGDGYSTNGILTGVGLRF
ncbi:porin family protein [Sphingomonas sp. CL5.1]|uniref:outer membrane protein n=1 Tax=Sphingomonas sp. CL5.1 TaxID=2653203 RepID=UPI0015819577|nr:outer membrane beta-barrel protein [Sphingomonas sp. CL5.1]QKR99500.1 porin family protein [Sphingomonas sp. CL5.1]